MMGLSGDVERFNADN